MLKLIFKYKPASQHKRVIHRPSSREVTWATFTIELVTSEGLIPEDLYSYVSILPFNLMEKGSAPVMQIENLQFQSAEEIENLIGFLNRVKTRLE